MLTFALVFFIITLYIMAKAVKLLNLTVLIKVLPSIIYLRRKK